MADLTAGRLKPGAVLPSQERLAERFGVTRPTVRRALAEMEQEGLLRREERRGTFVSDDARQRLNSTTGPFALVMAGTHDLEDLALIHGFEQGCRKANQAMVLCDSDNDLHQQGDSILRLSQMDIAGLAVLPVTDPPTPAYHATALQSRGIPLVFCHRGVKGIKAPLLSVPHEEQGLLVGRAFAERGHRRVAMLIGYRADEIRDAWARGVRQGLRTVGGELPDEFIFTPKTTSLDYTAREEETVAALKRMFNAEHPPTAMYVVEDTYAQVVHFVLRRLGLRVPEDVSLIGLGDVERNGPFVQRLTSVVIDGAKLAGQAVELLCEIQSGKRELDDQERIVVPIALTDGKTLGPAPTASYQQNLE